MKLELLQKYDGKQNIVELLKTAVVSDSHQKRRLEEILSLDSIERTAEQLVSLGALDLPIKIGDTLYAVVKVENFCFGTLSPANSYVIEPLEVTGIGLDKRRGIVIVRYDDFPYTPWRHIDGCFLTYEEAQEHISELIEKEANCDKRVSGMGSEYRELEKKEMIKRLTDRMKSIKIGDGNFELKNLFSSDNIQAISEHLISNGVLLPPVNFNDPIYSVYEDGSIYEKYVDSISYDGKYEVITEEGGEFERLDNYFLTRSDAVIAAKKNT